MIVHDVYFILYKSKKNQGFIENFVKKNKKYDDSNFFYKKDMFLFVSIWINIF